MELNSLQSGYIRNLRNAGFRVTLREKPAVLPDAVKERYGSFPVEYLQFLDCFDSIINKDETAWFNSIEDFSGASDSAFLWNEFESQSLEAFEGDEEETGKIREFWDIHIPILMAVNEYQYMAICLDEYHYGEIVYGVEPEYEETTRICGSFGELMALVAEAGAGSTPKAGSDSEVRAGANKYLKYFI